MKPPSVRSADEPLDDPEFWRAIVDRLGLSPMPCPYSIKDLAAENGVERPTAPRFNMRTASGPRPDSGTTSSAFGLPGRLLYLESLFLRFWGWDRSPRFIFEE
jgi:hypothetical protein